MSDYNELLKTIDDALAQTEKAQEPKNPTQAILDEIDVALGEKPEPSAPVPSVTPAPVPSVTPQPVAAVTPAPVATPQPSPTPLPVSQPVAELPKPSPSRLPEPTPPKAPEIDYSLPSNQLLALVGDAPVEEWKKDAYDFARTLSGKDLYEFKKQRPDVIFGDIEDQKIFDHLREITPYKIPKNKEDFYNLTYSSADFLLREIPEMAVGIAGDFIAGSAKAVKQGVPFLLGQTSDYAKGLEAEQLLSPEKQQEVQAWRKRAWEIANTPLKGGEQPNPDSYTDAKYLDKIKEGLTKEQIQALDQKYEQKRMEAKQVPFETLATLADLPPSLGLMATKMTLGGLQTWDTISEQSGLLSKDQAFERWKTRELLDSVKAKMVKEEPRAWARAMDIYKPTYAPALSYFASLSTPSVEEMMIMDPKLSKEEAESKRKATIEQNVLDAIEETKKTIPEADLQLQAVGDLAVPGGFGMDTFGYAFSVVEAAKRLTPLARLKFKKIGYTDNQINEIESKAQRVLKEKQLKELESKKTAGLIERAAGATAKGIDATGKYLERSPKFQTIAKYTPYVTGVGLGYEIDPQNPLRGMVAGGLTAAGLKVGFKALKETPKVIKEISAAGRISAGGEMGPLATLGSIAKQQDEVKNLTAKLKTLAEGTDEYADTKKLLDDAKDKAKGIKEGGGEVVDYEGIGKVSDTTKKILRFVSDDMVSNIGEYARLGVEPTLIGLATGVLDSSNEEEMKAMIASGLLFSLGGRAVQQGFHKFLGEDPVITERKSKQVSMDALKVYRDSSPETQGEIDRLTDWTNVLQRQENKIGQAQSDLQNLQAEGASPDKITKAEKVLSAEQKSLSLLKTANVQTRNEFGKNFLQQLARNNMLINGTLKAGQNNVGFHILSTNQIFDHFRNKPEYRDVSDEDLMMSATQQGFYSGTGGNEYRPGVEVSDASKGLVFDASKPSIVVNSDALQNRMMIFGETPTEALNHETGHHFARIPEIQNAMGDARKVLFTNEIKDASGAVKEISNGLYSEKQLNEMFVKNYLKNRPKDQVAEIAKGLGVWDYNANSLNAKDVGAYMQEEILAELFSNTLSRNLGKDLDSKQLHLLDVARLKMKNNLLKSAVTKVLGLGASQDVVSELTNAKLPPEAQSAARNAVRLIQSMNGDFSTMASMPQAAPISKAEIKKSKIAAERYGMDSGLFATKVVAQVFDADGNPVGAAVDVNDPSVYEGSWRISKDGEERLSGYGQIPVELRQLQVPEGGTLSIAKQIATEVDGVTPRLLNPKDLKKLQQDRASLFKQAIDTPDYGTPGRFEAVSEGSQTYRGSFTPMQIKAIQDLPEGIVPLKIKKYLLDLNEAIVKKDGTRFYVDYAAVMDDKGNYKAFSPKIYDVVPIGLHLSKDGNFLVTTISAGRMMEKLNLWSDRMPNRLNPWGGSKEAFWADFSKKYLDNWTKGIEGSGYDKQGQPIGTNQLDADVQAAEVKKSILNDFLNLFTNETQALNLDRTTIPKRKGDPKNKNLDRTIMSMRIDHMAELLDADHLPKLPIDYEKAKLNFMPEAPIEATENNKRTNVGISFMPASEEDYAYRGQHKAPDQESGSPLHKVTESIYPDDFYVLPFEKTLQYYGSGEPRSDSESLSAILSAKDKPNSKVKVYRAVPKYTVEIDPAKAKEIEDRISKFEKLARLNPWSEDFKKQLDDALAERPQVISDINAGDWVTPSRSYAVDHGEGALNGQYRILSKSVPASHLFTEGNSLSEFGYNPPSAKGIQFMPADSENIKYSNPPSEKQAIDALSSNKRNFFGMHRDLEDGYPVGLRIDIPAFTSKGVYVVTVHEKKKGAERGSVGDRIGYDTIAKVDNPVFFSNEVGAKKIKSGESNKFPVATVEGQFNSSREIPKDINEWTPVGYNPKDHSYFYDKTNEEPVLSGDEAISVGNTVFVKNPVYGNKANFAFMPAETNYLISEAKKFTNPDDFVKSRKRKLFHFSKSENPTFSREGGSLSGNVSTFEERDMPRYEGGSFQKRNLIELYTDGKILDAAGDTELTPFNIINGGGDNVEFNEMLKKASQSIGVNEPPYHFPWNSKDWLGETGNTWRKTLQGELSKKGYVGYQPGAEIVITDPSSIKSKAQLVDIWNESQKGVQFTPAEQPTKYEPISARIRPLEGISAPTKVVGAKGLSLGEIEPPVRGKAMLPDMELTPTISEKPKSSEMIGATTSEKSIQSSDINTSAKPAPDAVIKPFSNALVSSAGLINFLPAYHGTPHEVDKFKLEKIGTGEGAQAYGWGLYFAQKKGTATSYRDKLTPRDRYTIKGMTLDQLKDLIGSEASYHVWDSISFTSGNLKQAKESLARWKKELDLESPESVDKAIEFVKTLNENDIKQIEGNLYKVDLDVKDEDLLDWDKPLSGQSDKIRENVLNESKLLGDLNREWNGNDLYKNLVDEYGGEKQASEYLNSIGIPGIRYLDGTSRNKGEGTYNYVVFDENLIKILDKNDKPVQDELPRATGLQFMPAEREESQEISIPDAILKGSGEFAILRQSLEGKKPSVQEREKEQIPVAKTDTEEESSDSSLISTGVDVPESVDEQSNISNALTIANSQSWRKGRDFKLEVQNRVLEAAKKAGVQISERTAEAIEYLARVGLKDGLLALDQNPNAIGWYDEKTKQALGVMSLLFPEIATDQNARFAFTWAMAVTSNGLKVDKNFELAERVYREFRKTGKMPTNIEAGQAQKAINEGLDLFNKLTKDWGVDNTRKFMQTDFTVGEISRLSKELSPGGEFSDTNVRGSAILGPKIGNGFFSNLYGMFDALTMDRWLVRTWGRWTGTLVEFNPELTELAKNRLQETINNLTPEDKARMDAMIKNDISQMGLEYLSLAIQKASMKPEMRQLMNTTTTGEEFRKAGNGYAKYLDGQKEAPSGPTERNFIREIFGLMLDELKSYPKYKDLTMADLQAVLWYAEKRLYETAKIKSDQDSLDSSDADGYEDDDAPDYANAAIGVARKKGVTEKKIQQVLENIKNDRTTTTRPETIEGNQLESEQQKSAGGFVGKEKQKFKQYVAVTTARRNRTGNEAALWTYARRSGSDGSNAGVLKPKSKKNLGVKYISEWKPGRKLATMFRNNELPPVKFLELDSTDKASAQKFADTIQQSKESSLHGASVYVYPTEDYQGMNLFLSDSGRSGFAVKPDGDIVSVFSMEKGSGRSIMEAAIAAGGKKLDAFDTILPEFYGEHGFIEAARIPWNDEFAPDGWDKQTFKKYNDGEPDVVMMVLDPKFEGEYEPRTDVYTTEYDQAVKMQNSMLRKIEKKRK